MKSENYDFTISGAGLVGSLLALALDKMGYSVCLIEKSNFDNSQNSSDYFYPLSLNYRSKIILENLGLWDQVVNISYPINELTITYKNNLSKIGLTSEDAGIDNLGFSVDRNKLLQIYRKSISKYFSGDLKVKTEIRSVKKQKRNLVLLTNSESLNSKYLIVSDGIESELSKLVSPKVEKIDYNQISFLLNCNSTFRQNHAVQFFNSLGIFALIPHSNLSANLIITLNKDQEDKYFINGEPIHDKIMDLFSQYITDVKKLKLITSYNLITHRSDIIYDDRIMLFGNSLQLLHPVGAQGYNFSIRCIEYMIKHFRNPSEIETDINDFVKTVQIDRKRTISNVDIALKFMNNNHILSSLISRFAFSFIQNNSSLKSILLENVIGLNNYAFRK